MEKVLMPIASCSECFRHFSTENPYSTDGWDMMIDWVCNHPELAEPKKIQGSVEWFEESHIEIPQWCPFRIQKP